MIDGVDEEEGNSVAAATQAIRTVEGRLATSDLTPTQRRASELVLLETALDLGRGNILLGQWAEAESALRLVLPAKVSSRQVRTVASQWLAIALARQGRQAEAAGVLAQSNPEVLHSSYAKGDHSLEVRWNLARYHYASALTQPDDPAGREKRAVALRQANALLDESTAEAKQLSEERELRRLIDEARALPKR